jgi:ABC-type Fe3+/spermidine/putrescine transport system ATPase subunit
MLMIRPERVGLSMSPDPPPGSGDTTCLKGRVTDSAYLGATIEYRVLLDGSSAEIVARLAAGAPTYQRDQQVKIALPRDAMRLID